MRASADEYKCFEVQALKMMPRNDEAQAMLERVALEVEPIMRKHQWKCAKLSEFFPSQPNLYGININRRYIKVRLRPPSDTGSFLLYESVVGTMLHELAHMAIGPHSAAFYKLLDDLNGEYDTLKRSGHLPGSWRSGGEKLGGAGAHRPLSARERKAKAAAAAQARMKQSARNKALMGSGALGGGAGALNRLSPAELRARAADAAERRRRDELSCPTARVEAMQANQVGGVGGSAGRWSCPLCTLSNSMSDVLCAACGNGRGAAAAVPPPPVPPPQAAPPPRLPPTPPAAVVVLDPPPKPHPEEPIEVIDLSPPPPSPLPAGWRCPTCTLLNDPSALVCNACGAAFVLPGSWPCARCTAVNVASATACAVCHVTKGGGAPKRARLTWPCGVCSFANALSLPVCEVCGTPRG